MKLDCRKCKQELPTDKFSRKSESKRGYSYVCKDCHNKYVREQWYVKNAGIQKAASKKWRESNRAKALATTYKCEESVIQALLDRGQCDICGSKKNLHIDHCHKTGIVRGILCRGCNHGLGNFQDDVDRLMAAAVYLKNREGQDS